MPCLWTVSGEIEGLALRTYERCWAALVLHRRLTDHEWQQGEEVGVCAVCGLRFERLLAEVPP